MSTLDARPFEWRLRKLFMMKSFLEPIIGGWPTRITASSAQEILEYWEKARALAEELLNDKPDSNMVKVALGDLLRMGHNMDVPGAAEASQTLLKEAIAADPDDSDAHYALACFYVTRDTKLAPHAERHFLRAAELNAPQINPNIFQGLGFACFYQNKVSEAIDYFEKYLAEVKNDPEIKKLVADLKAGKKFQIIHR